MIELFNEISCCYEIFSINPVMSKLIFIFVFSLSLANEITKKRINLLAICLFERNPLIIETKKNEY